MASGIRRYIPENDLLDPTLAITKMLEPRNDLGLIFGNEISFLIKNSVFVLAMIVFGFIFNFYIPNVLEIILITIFSIIILAILVEFIRMLNNLSKRFNFLGILITLSVIFIIVSILGFF